jgi:hypothetical protein
MSTTEEAFVDGLGQQAQQYMAGDPDPDVIIWVLGTLVAYTFATLARAAHLMPDQVEEFLDEFCTTLCQMTWQIIRKEDETECQD